ncbi:unnamed protein product [Ectocarpus fasciculatus]
MKFFTGITLLGLAWAATANPEEEHMERKTKTADMVSHMNRHLRDAGEGHFSRKEAAKLKRQAREDEFQSKKARKESKKEAMRAEKMRRAAEHLGDNHRQHVHMNPAMEHRVHDTKGSLARSGRKGQGSRPDSKQKMQQKKSLQKLAREMSHSFDPAAVHEAMGKKAPGAREPRASTRTGSTAPRSMPKKMNGDDVKKAQHKLAKAAHAMRKSVPEDAEVDAAEPAKDGEE